MIYTTLNAIRAQLPRQEDWLKMLKHLGKTRADNEPLGLDAILAGNGLDDALWCLRAVEGHDHAIRQLALSCARHVEHLSNDPHARACNDVTARYLSGSASCEELNAAEITAHHAITAASWPNPSFAWPAAAWAAAAAAATAARDAAWAAEREWQRAEFVKMLEAAS